MSIKRIEDMLRTKKLGDVARNDMLSFLEHDGYQVSGGKGGHTKLIKAEAGLIKSVILPSGRILRKDQVRYVLKEANYI